MKSVKSAAHRRGALMAASSLGVLSLMALPVTVAVAPGHALAANECGVQVGDDPITCPAGTYPTGITYSGGTVPVTIDDTAVVSDGGINLGGSITSLTSAVVTPDAGDLQITNTTGAGINLNGGATTVDLTDNDGGDAAGFITGTSGVSAIVLGPVSLNLGNLAINATSAGGIGIVAIDAGVGDVSVNASGDITSAGSGVVGGAVNGAVSINVGNVTAAGLYGVGGVTLGTGNVDINTGAVSGATYSVIGQVTDGNLTVNSSGALTGDLAGMSTGAGSINLNAYSGVTGNVTAQVTGTGSVSIYASSVTGAVSGSTAFGGSVNITTGDVGNGVTASAAGGGSASISSGAVTGDVVASADTGGNASANTGAVTGDVTVTATGGGSASASTGDVTGSVTASADTGGGVNISTGAVGDGVNGTATGGGGVNVSTGGAITNGIVATADSGGAVNVTSTGDVDGGITATSSGGGTVTVTAGNVNVATGTPIVATSDSGDVSVTLNGVATGDSGFMAQLSTTGSATVGIGSGVTAGQADFDITAGNMLTINNGGTWTGATDFTGYTSGHFNNSSTWDAAAITWTDGDDSFSNTGTANFPGTNTYDFMGGTDSFSNGGTMTAGDLTLTNLETFDNGGTLTATTLTLNEATSFNNSGTASINSLGLANATSFHNGGTYVFGTTAGASTLSLPAVTDFTNTGTIVFGGTTTASDGETNDRIAADGATFTGGGTFLMDVNLNAGNQADCSAATAGDCLSLVGGSTPIGTAAPVTTIKLNAVGGAGAGGLNRIVLVDVSGGTSSADAFKLSSDSPTDQSLFFYRLDYDATAKQFAITGIAGRGIYEFPQISTAAQDVWYSSTGTYFEREADLRNQLDVADGPGVWLKGNHVITNRQGVMTTTHGAESFDYDLERKQTTNNIIGGVDLFHGSGDGQAYAVGLTAGKLDSEVDFKTSTGSTDLQGTSYGAYATWLSDVFFVDGIIQANKLDVDQHGDWNTGGFASGKVKSTGAQVEGGWRIPVNGGEASVEPLASFSYVKTSFDDLVLPNAGGTIKLDDAKSMRGSLGVRLSGDAHLGGMTLKLSGTGRIWDEFEGDNKSVLQSAGRKLALGDDFGGTFGELGVGLNLFSASHKVSGFFSESFKFKTDYSSSDTAVGVRVQF